MANQRRVAEKDELDRRIEQIIDTRLVRRLNVALDRLIERMGAVMETRQKVDPRRDRVPNSTANLEEIEYDSNSEGDATLFFEEDPSDGAFFVAGGDGEPEFDEEEEIVTRDGVPNLMCEKEDMESESSRREELGEKDEWYSFVDSKGSGKQIGWAKNVNWKQEAVATNTGDGKDHEMPNAKPVAVVEGVISDVDKMFGVVSCRRRRKRKAPDISDLDKKKYEIHISRRPKRLKAKGIKADTCVPFRGLACHKVNLEMYELSGLLSEDLIRGVYSSHGVHFLWDPSSTFGSGICKLFGTRDDILMFLANFSAIPDCFRSIHFGIFLKHHPVPSPRVNNLTDEQIGSDDDVEPSSDRTSLPSNTKPVVDASGGRLVLHLPLRTLKSNGRSAPSRHGVNTHGIRKRRSSFKTVRARNPSLMDLDKNNGALASDIVSAKKNGFPFSSIVSGRKVRRSSRKKPAQVVNDISTAMPTATTALAPLQDIDSTSCFANLLIIESDKYFREEGATVLLEPSASGEWFLVVKREGLTRYTYKANEVMKPDVSNWFSYATIWTGDNGWTLEFLNRDDWFKFRDLYKECFD
ncbi:hypothetical protein CDL15_Pgr001815 [Punica granatum]|uniref:Uncharacterized protein n=1 Tax=Punica granatum TaxID=22663 RepID=A0A218XCK8_PUNGR|nr:hypothetical protein CDL15_Pgr001815 [Punica granatum]